jgi:hypothetical protein
VREIDVGAIARTEPDPAHIPARIREARLRAISAAIQRPRSSGKVEPRSDHSCASDATGGGAPIPGHRPARIA